MADFVTKFTEKEHEVKGPIAWMVWTDGSSNQCARGVGVILRTRKEDVIEYVLCLQFSKTNNEAEYEVVLTGLDLAKAVGALSIVIHNDSQVIVEHINVDYEAKGERMKEYLSMVKKRVGQKFLAKFVPISREENEKADHLAKAASAECMYVLC